MSIQFSKSLLCCVDPPHVSPFGISLRYTWFFISYFTLQSHCLFMYVCVHIIWEVCDLCHFIHRLTVSSSPTLPFGIFFILFHSGAPCNPVIMARKVGRYLLDFYPSNLHTVVWFCVTGDQSCPQGKTLEERKSKKKQHFFLLFRSQDAHFLIPLARDLFCGEHFRCSCYQVVQCHEQD